MTRTPPQALMTCEDLNLGYEGRSVLTGVNAQVHAGDYLCIVGENGSGKTTLMKAILGLIAPLSGKITMKGGLRREEIGYLPQQTPVQRDFPASVREVVLSGCLGRLGRRPFYTRMHKQQAMDALARLGIRDLAAASYRTLSGGQQQRVLLARALCAAQTMLLLDEPAAGLDPNITEELYKLIHSLNREGMTIIMISHDMQSAARYASHILHLAGKPLFFGTAGDYLRSDLGRLYTLKEAL